MCQNSCLLPLSARKITQLLLLFIFITAGGRLGAQEFKPSFRHLTTTEGLSQNNVTCILQDKKGFIWLGTQDGLNKYDGYGFTVYQNVANDAKSLSNNYITSIVEDEDGNIWIGTQGGGLNKYDPFKNTFSHFKHNPKDPASIGSNRIRAVYEDRAGTLWIGTDGEGLDKFNAETNTFTHYKNDYKVATSIPYNIVNAIFEDSRGNLWVGTHIGGLSRMDRKKETFHNYHTSGGATGLNSNKISQIFEDSRKRLWIATDHGGLSMYHPGDETFTHYLRNDQDPNSISANDVISLGEDLHGNLWIGTRNGGLNILDRSGRITHHYKNVYDAKSLSNNSIYSILRDRTGNMWVGTFAGGVNMHNALKENFKHYKPEINNANSLSHNEVLSILEDSRGFLWVGTDGGGLNKLDRATGAFTHYKSNGAPNTITDNVIMSLVEDGNESLWLSTLNTGLNVRHANSENFINYKYQNMEGGGDHWNAATCMIKDYEGNIWIGTWDLGVTYYNVKEKTTYHYRRYSAEDDASKTPSNNIIFSLHEDKAHNIWIGTQAHGLSRLDRKTGRFEHYTHQEGNPQSLSGNQVNAILEDSSNKLWIGTNEGLNLFDREKKTFTSFKKEDGLPNNVIQGILEDGRGNLWLSTNKGISRFNPAKKTFRNYDVSDGLQGNEFKRNAYYKSRTGEMFFGGTNGMSSFHPDSIRDNPEVPAVALTNFLIFNKPVSIDEEGSPLMHHIDKTKEITLPYHQSVFTFEFAALNFIMSDKNQYAYKLDGFDKEWNMVGGKRSATYTNLDPGNYIFKVKASNNDGVWNEEGASLALFITPPFWQTWWFRTILAMSVVGGALTFYKVRMDAVKEQKELLEKQVKEQTTDIRKANDDLLERQEEIMQQQEEMQAQADLLLEINNSLRNSQEEIALQRDHLKIANEQVMSSIQYAQTIQLAILPSAQSIAAVFPQHFILYRPKDVVSGDFYWFLHLSREDTGLDTDLSFMAVVDCTGHGVPGAFMSIIGSTLLNEIVNQKQVLDPAQILEELDGGIKHAVEKAKGINTAGMDVCLCRFERAANGEVKILYAGAKRNLLYVPAGETQVQKLLADRRSIGSSSAASFTTQQLVLQAGSLLYMNTDGYEDQNDPAREKLGSARFRTHVSKLSGLSILEQQHAFEQLLDEHQQDAEQRDDITLLGIRL